MIGQLQGSKVVKEVHDVKSERKCIGNVAVLFEDDIVDIVGELVRGPQEKMKDE